MRRLTAFLVGPVSLVVLFAFTLVLLGLVVTELRRGHRATVHLKPGVVGPAAADRSGEVRTTDKFVTIKPDTGGKEEVFGWEHVLYISDAVPSSQRLDRVIDAVDLLSKLGIAATVIFFMVGLYQYRQAQKWEREKFLAASVKELVELKSNRNGMQMIDSLAQYGKGRMIELFPDEENSKDRKVFVTNEEIFEALTTTPRDDLEEADSRAIAIRDCFDSFLSYMGAFEHYIEQDLITKEGLLAHLGYWIILFGPKSSFSACYKDRIFEYGRNYKLTDFEKLINRYNNPSAWENIVGYVR